MRRGTRRHLHNQARTLQVQAGTVRDPSSAPCMIKPAPYRLRRHRAWSNPALCPIKPGPYMIRPHPGVINPAPRVIQLGTLHGQPGTLHDPKSAPYMIEPTPSMIRAAP